MKSIILKQHEAAGIPAGKVGLIVRPVPGKFGPGASIVPFEGFWKSQGLIGDIPVRWRNGFIKCPFGVPGDVLACRETWCQKCDDGYPVYNTEGNLDHSCFWYAADGVYVVKDDGDGGIEYTKSGREASPWISASRMPAYAVRTHIRVVSVEVKRVQAVTLGNARLYGTFARWRTEGGELTGPDERWRAKFRHFWNADNPRHPFESNPWCWFSRVEYLTELEKE